MTTEPMTEAEKDHIVALKNLHTAFVTKCIEIGRSRELSLAITSSEQAMLWAMHHVMIQN